jgi:hypothetical protein
MVLSKYKIIFRSKYILYFTLKYIIINFIIIAPQKLILDQKCFFIEKSLRSLDLDNALTSLSTKIQIKHLMNRL